MNPPAAPGLSSFARRNWFSLSLLAVALLPVLERSGRVVAAGRWLGAHGATALCVSLMFVFSGVVLNARALRRGAADLGTVALTLGLIFAAAPCLALALSLAPLEPGTRVGLLLVAVMPTTLSSGVVMATVAGGNPATAVVVTLAASVLGIFTIPPSLEWFLGLGAGSAAAVLDKSALALKLCLLVVLPLFVGMGLRRVPWVLRVPGRRYGTLGQLLVLTVVWIAVSRSAATLQGAPETALWSALLALVFHLALFGTAVLATGAAGLGRGRREVVWFLGSQKTLPVAILLQTALFPTLGNALVYCVMHHIVHLSVDGVLATRLRGE